jgi:hypothetical protein
MRFNSEEDKRRHKARRGLAWEECRGEGFPVFNKSQARLRWRLCKDALRSDLHSIQVKECYEDKLEMFHHSSLEFFSHEDFNEKYTRIRALGWNCKWAKYLSDTVPEGSFFPFVRFNQNKSRLIDTGCIWIGSRSSYPRIYVDNNYCKWYFPINLTGEIIWEPFVPFSELKYNRAFLSHENSIAMFERRNARPEGFSEKISEARKRMFASQK